MSVIYKVVTRPSDPRVPNSPKKYYPQLITLGQSVNLKYIAQKMQGYSSLSIGDIKSVIQNFVEKMKEQLLEGKSVNIEGLGVFMLTACSKVQTQRKMLRLKVWTVYASSFRQIKNCVSRRQLPVRMKNWI